LQNLPFIPFGREGFAGGKVLRETPRFLAGAWAEQSP